MSFALLWLFNLLEYLLWFAAGMAFSYRVRSKWIRRLLLVAFFALQLLILSYSLVFETDEWLSNHIAANGFEFAFSLWVTYLLGAFVIFFLARRGTLASDRRAATWGIKPLVQWSSAAWLIELILIGVMDSSIRSKAADWQAQNTAEYRAALGTTDVPADQNAATVFAGVFNKLKRDPWLSANLPSDGPVSRNSAEIEMLTRLSNTVPILRRAAGMPQCWITTDQWNESPQFPPNLTPTLFVTASTLLQLHAQLCGERRDIDSAIQDIRAILRMSRQVTRSASPDAFLSGGIIENHAIIALQSCIGGVTRKDQLDAIGFDELPSLGELALRSATIDECDMKEELIDNFGGLTKEEHPHATLLARLEQNWDTALTWRFRVFRLRAEYDGLQTLYDVLHQSLSVPYWEAQPQIQALREMSEGRPSGPPHPQFATIEAGGLWSEPRILALGQGDENVTRVAIAMTRWRLDNGGFPSTLDKLVPKYLSEIPPDPFDGKPIHLLVQNGQWVIYSVGPDSEPGHDAPPDAKLLSELIFTLRGNGS